MFYAHVFLSKKGPLAKVWLAAHWDKKLTKAHVFETDVEATVDNIISPQVKMALRTSGHLLLGVVRIYSRKQKYLIQDLGEACAKIRMAFRPGIVDLPAEGTVASTDTITLPEIFHDFETAVADLGTFDMEDQFTLHRSRAEEITMAENLPSSSGMFALEDDFRSMENDFGEMIEDIEIPRRSVSLADESHVSDVAQLQFSKNDGISMEDNQRLSLEERGRELNNFGGTDFLGDAFGLVDGELAVNLPDVPGLEDINLDGSSVVENNKQPLPAQDQGQEQGDREEEPMEVDQPAAREAAPDLACEPVLDETIRSEFILQPLDTTLEARRRPKRKRKLLVDSEIELSSSTIRANLSDASDILVPKCFPPPTKKALFWKDAATCEQLFIRPTLPFIVSEVASLITRNFIRSAPGQPVKNVAEQLPDMEVMRNADTTADAPLPNNADMAPPIEANLTPPASPDRDNTLMEEPPPIDVPNLGIGDDLLNIADEEQATKIIPDLPDLESSDNLQPSQSAEERGNGEANDELEQRRWTKRTQQVLRMVARGLSQQKELNFKSLTRKCSKKQAAARFYTCLLLTKEGAIRVKQDTPYGDILIEKGLRYTEAV